MRIVFPLLATSLLSACAGQLAHAPVETGPVTVKIVAFNDFHGNLEPPKRSIEAPGKVAGETVQVPAGGAAYFASAIEQLRSRNPNTAVVAAGDLIGASPLVSALFLDEPTIAALNLINVDYNALGNHEFDKGSAEILRIQDGGCDKHSLRQPCRLEPFAGAKFRLLSANTLTQSGATLVQPYGIKTFGSGARAVKVGFIGLTLKEAPSLVTPAGVAGLTFGDEANAANALVPKLKAEGADAIVILIHQGAATKVGYHDKSCDGLSGEILPILDRLDPAIDVVVSGHTHNAYVCDYGKVNPTRPFLLTSAGYGGTLITDLDLVIDPAVHRVLSKRADNVIVQGEAFTGSKGPVPLTDLYPRFGAHPQVAALVSRYAAAAAPVAAERVGRLSAPALRTKTEWGEQVLGNLIADAQLAATRAPEAGGAEIAFMNMYGVRADLEPAADGTITYGQVFTVQPFGNTLMVKSFTGRQIRAILEQQFDSGSNSVESPNFLNPSASLHYAYDLKRPAGQRILDVRVNGQPLQDDRVYRVAMSNFLASGGDNFTRFRDGTDVVGGISDLDALVAYLGKQDVLTPPATDRTSRR